jgi:hypothetical protein
LWSKLYEYGKGCRAMLLKNANLSATKLVTSGSTNKRMNDSGISGKEKKRIRNVCVVHTKVETPIHDNIRELVTWECKEHGVKL